MFCVTESEDGDDGEDDGEEGGEEEQGGGGGVTDRGDDVGDERGGLSSVNIEGLKLSTRQGQRSDLGEIMTSSVKETW